MDSDIDTSTEAGRKARKTQTRQIVKGCEEKSGELLAYAGTESAARDMGVLRGLVGDEKLNYLGLFYGTQLGGTYADLFPEKVGRMVLDGITSPQLSFLPFTYTQMLGFEKPLERYTERCVKGGNCPLGSSVDAAGKKVCALLDQAHTTSFKTLNPSRLLDRSMLRFALADLIYKDEWWPLITGGVQGLIEDNDDSTLVLPLDAYISHADDSLDSNSMKAYWAINCTDYVQSSEAEYQKYAKKLKQEAVIFGSFSAEDDLAMCVYVELPYHPKASPGPYRAKGSAPIMVIDTKHDPATPYSWAQNIRKTLDNLVLLTREGDGHATYGRGSPCIDTSVGKYLLTGEVPKDGLNRPVERPQGQKTQKRGDHSMDSAVELGSRAIPSGSRVLSVSRG